MIPFDRLRHVVRVPVRIGGDEYRFLVDTGIGITVVSSALAARADVRQTGYWLTARRMSGQEIQAPLVRLPRVTLGEHTVNDHLACVSDLGDDFYAPTKVQVAKGGTVKWTWGSSNRHPHSVTLTKGPKGAKIKKFRSQTRVSGYSFKQIGRAHV